MAVTVSLVRRSKTVNRKITIADVTLDNSYTTGGLSITPAQLGLNAIDIMIITGGNGYVCQYDYTNKKILAYASSGTEVTATTDLHTITLRVKAIGQ